MIRAGGLNRPRAMPAIHGGAGQGQGEGQAEAVEDEDGEVGAGEEQHQRGEYGDGGGGKLRAGVPAAGPGPHDCTASRYIRSAPFCPGSTSFRMASMASIA